MKFVQNSRLPYKKKLVSVQIFKMASFYLRHQDPKLKCGTLFPCSTICQVSKKTNFLIECKISFQKPKERNQTHSLPLRHTHTAFTTHTKESTTTHTQRGTSATKNPADILQDFTLTDILTAVFSEYFFWCAFCENKNLFFYHFFSWFFLYRNKISKIFFLKNLVISYSHFSDISWMQTFLKR